jgi:Ca-activated chloride channel family protein
MNMDRKHFLILCMLATAGLGLQFTANAQMVAVETIGDRFLPREHFPDPAPLPPHVMRRRIRPPIGNTFEITASRVDVRIHENIATTTITQHLKNTSNRRTEARLLIPLPGGASIHKSALSMDDQMIQGNLYNADEAQRVYENIVNSQRDPALLRFAGDGLFEARVFPIEPNQTRRLQFSYDMELKPKEGLYDFRHILAGTDMYRVALGKFELECVIRSDSGVGPVYSPSHRVAVERRGANEAVVKFAEEQFTTAKDFHLYFAPAGEAVAIRMLAHKARNDEDGYFMLLVRPDDQLGENRVMPKEAVFVVDTSGSMSGEKMNQTKEALRFCLNRLKPEDRFNLITFGTKVLALSDKKLLAATPENLDKARRAVDGIEAVGGTNINGALREAYAQDFSKEPSAAQLVLFMTDGKPSIGLTDTAAILEDARASNKELKARTFVLGVGADLNAHLLDKLALQAQGTSVYIAPGEDLEISVSDFYRKIDSPVMTDLVLEFADAGGSSGVTAHSIYPKEFPALYKGSELLVTGRYKGNAPGLARLKGNVRGQARVLERQVTWPAREESNAFVPRIWAMRKIGYLLEDIRLHGPNQELITQVVQLSQEHGIVTPYTSQLVLEPGMQPPGGPVRPLVAAKGGEMAVHALREDRKRNAPKPGTRASRWPKWNSSLRTPRSRRTTRWPSPPISLPVSRQTPPRLLPST